MAAYMFPITTKRGTTSDNCPFECPLYRQQGGEVTYKKGDCPVAEDLFERMVSLRLNQWYTPEDCELVAGVLNSVLARFCTPATDAAPWIC